MTRDRIFFLAVTVAIAVFVISGRTPANSATGDDIAAPEVVAATFSSAWCAPCKVLKPRVANIIPTFDGEPVKFVELDFTFGEDRKLRRMALDDGFEVAFDRFAGATGFTLLIDRDTGEIIDTLTMAYSEKAMRASIAAALAVAEATPSSHEGATDIGR